MFCGFKRQNRLLSNLQQLLANIFQIDFEISCNILYYAYTLTFGFVLTKK